MTHPRGSVLDAAALRAWLDDAREALARQRVELNRLNVFPWPDQDTGTNMAQTMAAAAAAASSVATEGNPALAELAGAVGDALWHTSPGASGQILARILTALLGTFADMGEIGPNELRIGLKAAAAAAQDMRNPVEGTMVTLMVAVAEALATVDPRASLAVLAAAGSSAASVALAKTTSQLPDLAALGIVDAGAMGLGIVLDALFDRCR